MLFISDRFDFKLRLFPGGTHRKTKVLISQNCHFVVTAFFLWGQTSRLEKKKKNHNKTVTITCVETWNNKIKRKNAQWSLQ